MSSLSTIKAQLEREILQLQGYKPLAAGSGAIVDCGPMAAAFPNGVFPLGGLHEFLTGDVSDAAATTGFIASLLSMLMQQGGVAIWICAHGKIFPPGLKQFGLEPDRVLFIEVRQEQEALWAMEEALQYNGLAAVVGELNSIDLTASRRLQLAVEKSRVTGFLIRSERRSLNTIACVARWKVGPLASETTDGLPGVGPPRWQASLLKVRNGHTGHWLIEWKGGRFHFITEASQASLPVPQRKTG